MMTVGYGDQSADATSRKVIDIYDAVEEKLSYHEMLPRGIQ